MRKILIVVAALLIYTGTLAGGETAGQASYVLPGIMSYPVTANYITIYYSNGVPFAAVESDSSSCLLTLVTQRIGHAAYLRLWLLFRNKAAAPLLLEPFKAAKLSLNAGDRIIDLAPLPADEVAQRMDSVQQAARAAGDDGDKPKPDSAKPRPAEAAAWEPSADPGTGAFLNEAYRNSQAGVPLRKHTVFRDKGVAGYLYFRLPQVKPEQVQHITLMLSTPDGQKLLRFSTQEGE